MKILFVCSGNTCRSPLAQGLMNKRANDLYLDLECESAGISAFSGDCASQNSIKAAEKYGVDISSHRARAFSPYMAEEYDLFVAMTEQHKKMLSPFVAENKLISFSIPDPYGCDEEEYLNCAEKINQELDRLTEEYTVIEKMNEKHIKAVAEIEKQCFSQPWSEDGLRSEFTNEGAHFFVCTCFGKAVAYMGMHTVLDECYIANVAVLPSFRRKGIGEKLVRHCIEKAREKGCAFISLEVRVSNKNAIDLYKKAGFLPVGERKNFYSRPTENALIMTKELR